MRQKKHMTSYRIQFMVLNYTPDLNEDPTVRDGDFSENEKKGSGSRNVSSNLGDVVAEQMLTMCVKQ